MEANHGRGLSGCGAGFVHLLHADEAVVEADYQTLRKLQPTMFHVDGTGAEATGGGVGGRRGARVGGVARRVRKAAAAAVRARSPPLVRAIVPLVALSCVELGVARRLAAARHLIG